MEEVPFNPGDKAGLHTEGDGLGMPVASLVKDKLNSELVIAQRVQAILKNVSAVRRISDIPRYEVTVGQQFLQQLKEVGDRFPSYTEAQKIDEIVRMVREKHQRELDSGENPRLQALAILREIQKVLIGMSDRKKLQQHDPSSATESENTVIVGSYEEECIEVIRRIGTSYSSDADSVTNFNAAGIVARFICDGLTEDTLSTVQTISARLDVQDRHYLTEFMKLLGNMQDGGGVITFPREEDEYTGITTRTALKMNPNGKRGDISPISQKQTPKTDGRTHYHVAASSLGGTIGAYNPPDAKKAYY